MSDEIIILITKVITVDDYSEFKCEWCKSEKSDLFCLLLDDDCKTHWISKSETYDINKNDISVIVLDGSCCTNAVIDPFVKCLFCSDLIKSKKVLMAIHYGHLQKGNALKALEVIDNSKKYIYKAIDYGDGDGDGRDHKYDKIRNFRRVIKENEDRNKIEDSLYKLKNWLREEIRKKDVKPILNQFLPLYFDIQTLSGLINNESDINYVISFLAKERSN